MPADPMPAAATVGTAAICAMAVIGCFADRGRTYHRVGGLSIEDATGENGLT